MPLSSKPPGSSPSARSIGQRLRLEMQRRGVSSSELARRAGVKTSFIYDIISGKSANPSTVKLARVAEHLGVSLSSLASDRPFVPGASEPQNDYISIARIMVDVSSGGNAVVSLAREDEPYHFRRTWIQEHLSASPENLRLLHVRGDSMEPTLYHNDLTLIDTTRRSPSPPGIFVLFDGFGLVAKRLELVTRHGQASLRIISDNSQYSVYERPLGETSIIGRVVWFAREM